MSYEVYTYGDQTLLRFIFNAVAMLFDNNDYKAILRFSILGGFAFIISQVIFNKNYGNMLTSFFIFVILYNLAFGMKARVVLIDKIDPTSAPVMVNNVPFALAYWAFLTTKMGTAFTSKMEQAFYAPAKVTPTTPLHEDSAYTKTGMLFYSNLMLEAKKQSVGATLKYSMDEYFKQCVYAGIQHNLIQINNLLTSTDMFTFIRQTAMPGWFTKYQDSKGIITAISCSNAYSNMQRDLSVEKVKWFKNLAHTMFPEKNEVAANTLVMTALPHAQAYFIKNAGDAQKMLNDQIAKEAAIDAGAVWGASIGSKSATDLFLKARTNIQTLNTYHSTGLQAAEWVPILKNVFEAIYYGAFPLVCLLLFTPMTKSIIMGYGGAFIWLQSWAPLYAILNLIMTLKEHDALSDTSNDLIHSSGMTDIMLKTQAQAGMLSMSIPFLAGGIVFGASRMGGLARTLTAPAQQAASQSATEQTTGNHSYGNVSLGNFSSNNWNSNKVNTSSSVDMGSQSYVDSHGGKHTSTPDGKSLYQEQQSSFRSSFNLSQMAQKSLQTTAAQATSAIDSNVTSALENMGSSNTQMTGLSKDQNINYNQAASKLKNFVQTHSQSMSSDLKSQILAYAEGGGSVDSEKSILGSIAKLTFGFTAKAGAGVRGEGSASSTDNNTASKAVSDTNEVRKSLDTLHSLSQKTSEDHQTSQAKAFSDGITSNLTKLEEAREMQSYLESNSSNYNRTTTQDVYDKVLAADGNNVEQAVKDMDEGLGNKRVAKAAQEVTEQFMKDGLTNDIKKQDSIHQTKIADNTDHSTNGSNLQQEYDNMNKEATKQGVNTSLSKSDIDSKETNKKQFVGEVDKKANRNATEAAYEVVTDDLASVQQFVKDSGKKILNTEKKSADRLIDDTKHAGENLGKAIHGKLEDLHEGSQDGREKVIAEKKAELTGHSPNSNNSSVYPAKDQNPNVANSSNNHGGHNSYTPYNIPSNQASSNTPSNHYSSNTPSNHPQSNASSNQTSSNASSNQTSSNTTSNQTSSNNTSNQTSSNTTSNHISSNTTSNNLKSDAKSNNLKSDTSSNRPKSDTKSNHPQSNIPSNKSSSNTPRNNNKS